MRRSEALQGVRVIKFRSVLERYESSELNQCEAAEVLGIGERTFRRWQQRHEESGEGGLLDRRLGRASGKRVPVGRRTARPTVFFKPCHQPLAGLSCRQNGRRPAAARGNRPETSGQLMCYVNRTI